MVSDRGSNILKAVNDTPGLVSVSCCAHVLQRAILEAIKEAKVMSII